MAKLTWQFEPLGHLPRVAPVGLGCLGLRLRLLLLLRRARWVGMRLLWCCQWLAGVIRGVAGSPRGREDTAEGGKERIRCEQMVERF